MTEKKEDLNYKHLQKQTVDTNTDTACIKIIIKELIMQEVYTPKFDNLEETGHFNENINYHTSPNIK